MLEHLEELLLLDARGCLAFSFDGLCALTHAPLRQLLALVGGSAAALPGGIALPGALQVGAQSQYSLCFSLCHRCCCSSFLYLIMPVQTRWP